MLIKIPIEVVVVKKNFLPKKAGNKIMALIFNIFMRGSFHFSKLYYSIGE